MWHPAFLLHRTLRSLVWGYVPLDYIVEASTMQSMGIYTCLKVYLIRPALEETWLYQEFDAPRHIGKVEAWVDSHVFIFFLSLQGYIGPPGLFGLPGADGERVSIFFSTKHKYIVRLIFKNLQCVVTHSNFSSLFSTVVRPINEGLKLFALSRLLSFFLDSKRQKRPDHTLLSRLFSST